MPTESGALGQPAPGLPTFTEGAPPTNVTLPSAQQYNTVTSTSVPAFSTPTLVHIEASGNIQVFKNWPPAEAGTEFASIPPQGGNQGLQTMNCYGVVTLWFQWTGTVYLGDCNGPGRTDAVLVHGVGSAQRGYPYPGSTPPACGYYPYTPCYSYAGGSQTITITPVAADLQLTASTRAVTSGQVVSFVASVSPLRVDNIDVPLQVQRWRWVATSGASTTVCGTMKTCTYQPQVSGTMYVDALANGQAQTKSVQVYVFPCLTGNGLLDDPDIRNGLRDAWAASGADSKPGNQRTERIGGLKCEAGLCTPHLSPVGPKDNACKSYFTPAMQGDSVVWHMHPFKPQDPTDPLPIGDSCPGSTGGMAASGPTWPDDYLSSGGRPHIVVDGSDVWAIPGWTSGPVPTPLDAHWFPRNGPTACDALAAPIL